MDLTDPISKLPGIGAAYETKLAKLEIFTVGDLLYHIPRRYLDFTKNTPIRSLIPGELSVIQGKLIDIKNQYTRRGRGFQLGEVEDATGKINIVWFNQPYLSRMLVSGQNYSFAGKVEWFGRKKTLVSPDFEEVFAGKKLIHTQGFIPIYPETAGLSSKWLRRKVSDALNVVALDEILPEDVLAKFQLQGFKASVLGLHTPKNLDLYEDAKRRLAFNELLFSQLRAIHRKADWKKNKVAHPLTVDSREINEFIDNLPFKLTDAQTRSVNEIIQDLTKSTPMNRLLEGDVGSGKTIVAAIGAYAAFLQGYQSVFLAPTQILALQHAQTLQSVFSNLGVRVTLVTSNGKVGSLGRPDIFVGTHALIHKKVKFAQVALVVIDEQQKFGVEQRQHLIKKSTKGKKAPHVLTMTATPIPRTIALTVYGDLDLSVLDELPVGRQKITTWIVGPEKRKGAYEWIAEKIKKENIQVYVVCPLIEESNKESMQQVKSAKKEFELLKKVFPKFKLDLLHGKMNQTEKASVITKFKEGKTTILVSTPVVEVGIDVTNATIILIEAAERFGLASLHQLRGRVGRGDKQSYCLIFTESSTAVVQTRLEALTKAYSGFELAELDLKLRGPGEVFGTRQHGFPEMKVATWQDAELIKSAREVALAAVKNPKKFAKLLKLFALPKERSVGYNTV